MSSTQITNLDLSEPQEVLDTEVKSKDPNNTSTLNFEDQEIQNNLSEEKQKDEDLESETIVKVQKQSEVVEVQQKDINNDSVGGELNQEEQDKENSAVTDVNANKTEQILNENKDQSEWSAVWDDNAQAYYYWNMVTNETTWENPNNNNNLTVQTANSEYSEQDYYYYYYSQYGYYPEYYYGYDNSASSDMTTTENTTTEPPTNPLDSLLDKIDKEVKSKLDGNSSKKKSSSASDSQYNDKQYQQEQEKEHQENQENQEHQEHQEHQEQQEQQEETTLTSSSTDLDPYYDQYQMATNDPDYQSFLAEHGGNDGSAEYKVTARFNAKTGKFQRDPTLNPEKFSADSKAIRQMSYFFDYDQFAETRGTAASNKRLSSETGDSIRSPKKLNKKDIEMFKQKKKEKKDMKKKSWLLSEND